MEEDLDQKLSSEPSTLRKLAVPAVWASLGGAVSFAGIDISSFDPVDFTYVWNPAAVTGVAGITAASAGFGHAYGGKIWNAIKFVADKAVAPVSRLLSRGEDDKVIQNAVSTRKAKAGIALGVASLLGAIVANHYNPLPSSAVDTQPVVTAAQKELDKIIGWPGQRNVHFLQHYVLGSPLDDVTLPPEFEGDDTYEQLNEWHNEQYGGDFGKSPLAWQSRWTQAGFWDYVRDKQTTRTANLKNEDGSIFQIFRFHDYRKNRVWRNYLVLNGKLIAPAAHDTVMDRRQGHPDLENTLISIEPVNRGKIYTIVIDNAQGYEAPHPETITIRELGKEQPLFGTPVEGFTELYIFPTKGGKLPRQTYLNTSRWFEKDETCTLGVKGAQETTFTYAKEIDGVAHFYRATEDGKVTELDSSKYVLRKID